MFDRIIRLSIGNPVFVNLLFLIICAAGIQSAMKLPVEQFPEVSLDRVTIDTLYPGSTATDVEELVTRPIEEALEDVADVKEINSISSEGLSNVIVTFQDGKNLQEGRSEVEKAVNTVDDLPEDAEVPLVKEMAMELPVVSLGVLRATSDRRTVDRLVDRLRDIDGVSSVEISGLAERKIFIDLDQRKILGLGLRPEQVTAAVRAARANIPAGRVEREGSDIFVKTQHRLLKASDVVRIPVAPGSNLRIGDVGMVSEGPDELDTAFFVDGIPAAKLTVGREEGANPLRIRDEAMALLPGFNRMVPAEIEVMLADDYTTPIRDRLEVVKWNALGGGLLVILVLYFLSGLRQAVLALWGMPVSYLMATLLMGQFGISVNVISTFALLIATGIIVDDAIVVIENVQRHLEMGKSRLDAAFEGAREVVLPVSVAVLTTMLAFMPLTMISGTMGRVMYILPSVIIFCLIGSLIEAMFILPGHLREFGSRDAKDSRTARLGARMRRIYLPVVRFTTRWRWLTIVAVTVAFFGVLGLATTLPIQFGAPGKPFELMLNYELPPGTGKGVTRDHGEELLKLVQEDVSEEAVRTTTLRVGSTQDRRSGLVQTGSNLGSIRWEFNYSNAFAVDYARMIVHLRDHLATDPDLGSFFVEEVQAGPPAGAGITARIRGREIEQVNAAMIDLKTHLRGWDGVSDIRDNYGSGKETFRVRVDQDRASLYGLTELDVGRAVRTALDGTVADEVSIDEEPVEIIVRYAGGRNMTRSELGDLLIPTRRGTIVRLDQVADLDRTREVGFIRREDGMRAVSVLAEVDGVAITALTAARRIEALWDAELVDRYPELTLAFGGEADELRAGLKDLPGAFMLALLLIYTVLALQFRSYIQPAIIISAVPFGLMGAILGLAIMGYDLSMLALFGMIALAGICVNDSLVMVDFINKLREGGRPVGEAAIEGAVQRLRPIVSTTATTVLGLTPLAIGLGGKDLILAPMAVSIAAGLGFATGLILLAIPAIYLAVEDVRRGLARVRRGLARVRPGGLPGGEPGP